jgi:hypothetical protein
VNGAIATRVAWRRRSTPTHYVGTLLDVENGIRLVGREPATGIELALSVPYDLIGGVRVSDEASDEVVGEPAVVIDITGADALLVRELGPVTRQTAELARRLKGLVSPVGSHARRRRTATG